jgi:hypothetical protein
VIETRPVHYSYAVSCFSKKYKVGRFTRVLTLSDLSMPSRQERRKAERAAAKRAPAQTGAAEVAAATAALENLDVNVNVNPPGDWTTQSDDHGCCPADICSPRHRVTGARAKAWCLLTHAEAFLSHGGQGGESLVPPCTRGSIPVSLSTSQGAIQLINLLLGAQSALNDEASSVRQAPTPGRCFERTDTRL